MVDELKGVLAAVPTPMNEDGSINTIIVKPIVDRIIKAGINGIVTTGTTGEVTTLTFEEHQNVVKAYLEAVNGKIPVIAGAATNSTKETIKYCQASEKLGVYAVMIVPPFYDPLPFNTLKTFYQIVSDHIKIPIMFYNLPGATGVHLSAEQIRELGQIKNLKYIKDTSGDAKEQVDLLVYEQQAEQIQIQTFNGWDTLCFSALALGAQGIIVGIATILPEECAQFYKTLSIDGNLKEARKQWSYLWELASFMESVNYPAGIKAGLNILGIDAGPLREPTLPLSEDELEKLRGILAKRTLIG
ncbi:hypothetical protein L7F22_019876 [Adiantum nelumboides]|nr:hypothetical protein [Adiantum nelumboides]